MSEYLCKNVVNLSSKPPLAESIARSSDAVLEDRDEPTTLTEPNNFQSDGQADTSIYFVGATEIWHNRPNSQYFYSLN